MDYSWSPHYWYVLESIARQVKPNDNINEIKNTFKCIGRFLPCQKCKDHFDEYYSNNEITSDNIVNWVATLKSSVSKPVNSCCGKKPKITLKSESLIKKMQQMI